MNSFSLAPLWERGDRKVVGEGVSAKMNAMGSDLGIHILDTTVSPAISF
jgi:hypothetical protein